MLSLPRFTRSLMDSLDDDFLIYPLDYLVPQQSAKKNANQTTQLAVPSIKDNKYSLSLDLHHFDPSEVSIKVDQNSLQISGKHEKKSDDGSHYEYREYQQHFTVPDNVLSDQLKCRLDEKGFLKIEAPVKAALEDKQERTIPIEFVQK